MKRPAFILVLCLAAGLAMGRQVPVSTSLALAAAAAAVALHGMLRRAWPRAFAGGQALWLAVVLVGVSQQRAVVSQERLSEAALFQRVSVVMAKDWSGKTNGSEEHQ